MIPCHGWLRGGAAAAPAASASHRHVPVALPPPDPITAGTIFDSTNLLLTVWFLAIYLVAQDKKGYSAMKLYRHLGISYNAAWRSLAHAAQADAGYDGASPLASTSSASRTQ